MEQSYKFCDKKPTNLTENVNLKEKSQSQTFFLDPAKLFDQMERMFGKILVAPPSEKFFLEMARALGVDKDELVKVAQKTTRKYPSMWPMSRGRPISCAWPRSGNLITAAGTSSGS